MHTLEIPQDSEKESILLSRMLNSINALNRGIYELQSTDFYEPVHQAIFSCMKLAFSKDIQIELDSLAALLKQHHPKHADLSYLYTIKNYGNIEESEFNFFISEIKRLSTLRQILGASQECVAQVNKNADPLALQSSLLEKIENILMISKDNKTLSIKDILEGNFFDSNKSYIEFIESQMENFALGLNTMRGIPTGYPRLDEHLSGICKGHYIIVGARPGVGKTTFILNLIHRLCIQKNIPLGFFSLEMTADEVMHKLISISAKVNHEHIFRGSITPDLYQHIVVTSHEIKESPLYIDDQSSLHVSQLIARAKRWISAYDIKILFIDYLGEIRGEGKYSTKQEEIQAVSKAIRNLAKSCKIPVVCICQLNRQNENEKRAPRKADLRESGQIEADAHSILLLHRPSQDDPNKNPGLVDVIIAKNRFGSEGKIPYNFVASTGEFHELKDFGPKAPEEFQT